MKQAIKMMPLKMRLGFAAFIIAILLLFGLALRAALRVNQIEGNICIAVNAGRVIDVNEAKFYHAAAHRAYVRAAVEHDTQRALDLDAAASDTNLAQQYERGAHYKFPGC